jgi:putative salt-induced outer membrane protein YdiY
MKRRSVCSRVVVVVLGSVLCTTFASAKRKDDVVVMKNGDRFTGEIKQLKYGELSFKASYMRASVALNWEDVKTIESKDAFIVSLLDGTRLTGVIGTTENGAEKETAVRVRHDGLSSNISPSRVVAIEQAEQSFLHQLTGSIDFGFSFANGNQSADYTTAVNVGYRARRDEYSLNASSDLNRNDEESTARHALTALHLHIFRERWFTAEIADFLHSERQELSLRSTLGGGFGRILYQTDHTRFATVGGMAYTHEQYSRNAPGTQERSNAEALAGVTFSTFRFKTLGISSNLIVYPSVNDPGRVRVVTNGDLKIELIRNLYWKFHAYENFDNKPPVNAPRNDLGASSSLGWTF